MHCTSGNQSCVCTAWADHKDNFLTPRSLEWNIFQIAIDEPALVATTFDAQSFDLASNPCRVTSKAFKNGILSFAAWHSVPQGKRGEKMGKLSGCVLEKDTYQDSSILDVVNRWWGLSNLEDAVIHSD